MQIPDAVRKCVGFLLFKDEHTKQVDQYKLAGTGFFVGYPLVEKSLFAAGYFITAKHVIKAIEAKSNDGKVYLRINTKVGDSGIFEFKIDQFFFHPDDEFVDIAVAKFAPDNKKYDHIFFPFAEIVTDEILKKENIGLGDELFITGLFSKHFGKEKNIPIVRVGNIAAMPEEKIKVHILGYDVNIDAYLVESRSIGGLSGSPVFVNVGPIRKTQKGLEMRGDRFYLLGLIHGHWDLDLANDINKENVNAGIAIVIPSNKLIEILNQKELVEERASKKESELKRLEGL